MKTTRVYTVGSVWLVIWHRGQTTHCHWAQNQEQYYHWAQRLYDTMWPVGYPGMHLNPILRNHMHLVREYDPMPKEIGEARWNGRGERRLRQEREMANWDRPSPPVPYPSREDEWPIDDLHWYP